MIFLLLNVLLLFVPESQEVTLVEFCSQALEHFAPKNSLTIEQWNTSLPSAAEMDDMAKLVKRIYSLTDFQAFDPSLSDFPALENKINVTMIENYIVIHEPFPARGALFPRNWGILAIADPTFATRTIHHSAAHFGSEGPIYEQAAYVGQETKSRSITLHGASRYSITPYKNSTCQKSYLVPDGAHNTNVMFHLWGATLLELSKLRSEEFTFIQWHGMAATNCIEDVFISMGSKTPTLYDNSTSAYRLNEAFNFHSHNLTSLTPGTGSQCRLIGSDNPLGRLINGVNATKVCRTRAHDKNIRVSSCTSNRRGMLGWPWTRGWQLFEMLSQRM